MTVLNSPIRFKMLLEQVSSLPWQTGKDWYADAPPSLWNLQEFKSSQKFWLQSLLLMFDLLSCHRSSSPGTFTFSSQCIFSAFPCLLPYVFKLDLVTTFAQVATLSLLHFWHFLEFHFFLFTFSFSCSCCDLATLLHLTIALALLVVIQFSIWKAFHSVRPVCQQVAIGSLGATTLGKLLNWMHYVSAVASSRRRNINLESNWPLLFNYYHYSLHNDDVVHILY